MRNRQINYEGANGQSLVEFAVSGIVILLLLVAIADFGRAFFTYLSMRDAAQEGAAFGSICPRHYNQIISRIRNTGNLPVSLADETQVLIDCYYWFDVNGNGVVDPGETWECNGGFVPTSGYGIQIRVRYPNFVITTPLLGSIIGNQISLQTEVTDTILRVVDPTAACP
jgi:Flp pilus assembly protein TadG